MMEDLELTLGTVQDTLILPASVNGEAVTVGAGASVMINKTHTFSNIGSQFSSQ